MSSFHKACGCTGGDGGCSYNGSWFDPCADYPRCEYGVAEAKQLIASTKQAAARKRKDMVDDLLRKAALKKLTAKERRLLGV